VARSRVATIGQRRGITFNPIRRVSDAEAPPFMTVRLTSYAGAAIEEISPENGRPQDLHCRRTEERVAAVGRELQMGEEDHSIDEARTGRSRLWRQTHHPSHRWNGLSPSGSFRAGNRCAGRAQTVRGGPNGQTFRSAPDEAPEDCRPHAGRSAQGWPGWPPARRSVPQARALPR